MSMQEKDMFFNGRKGENGKIIDRGLVGIRDPKVAEEFRATMRQSQAVRDAKRVSKLHFCATAVPLPAGP
jgi:hypothetical protein